MSNGSHDRVEHERWFVAQCVRTGIKATHQRREIYAELAATKDHPDAETLYRCVKDRIPAISMDTVYRNLRTLEEHGVVRKVGATGYRTRFDANMAPHHHFVCTECGLIRDFHDDRFKGYRPSRDVLAMGKIRSLHFELRGTCKTCVGRTDSKKR